MYTKLMRYVAMCLLLAACAESTPVFDASVDLGGPPRIDADLPPRIDADLPPRIDASGPRMDAGSPRVDAAPADDARMMSTSTVEDFCDGLLPAFCSAEERCGGFGFMDCEREFALACCSGLFDCSVPLDIDEDIVESCYEAVRTTECEALTEVPRECEPIFEIAVPGGI